GSPRRGAAETAPRDEGARGARAPARADRRRPPDDARFARDRRRSPAAEVQAAQAAPPGDLRALRRLHVGHERERLLPVGAARAHVRAYLAARRPHVLAQSRAPPVLELRRFGDGRLRAVLRRSLRVLDDQAARAVRKRDRGPAAADDLAAHALALFPPAKRP